MNWDRMVASATPSMPMPKPSTNSRSSRMFSTLVSTRKNSGREVSPTARRMPLPIL